MTQRKIKRAKLTGMPGPAPAKPPPRPPPIDRDPEVLRLHIFALGDRFGTQTYGDPFKVLAWAQEEIDRLRQALRDDHRDRTREVAHLADLVARMAELAERGDPTNRVAT